jgi:hypothetical protein
MLTTKGKAHVLLTKVRDNWETFTPDQRAECAELVARLSVAMQREQPASAPRSVRVPLVGRICA